MNKPFTFRIRTDSGRIAQWDGATFIDVTPTSRKVHEPRIELKRAPTEGGRIRARLRRAFVGMPKDAMTGSEVLMDPSDFELQRRAGAVERWRPELIPVIDTRRGIHCLVTRSELGEEQISGRYRPTGGPAVLFSPEQLEAKVSVVMFTTGHVDVSAPSAFMHQGGSSASDSIFAAAGTVHQLPRRVGLLLEQQGRAAVLEHGDSVVVDGREVEIPTAAVPAA
jgi:hypothetical protein